MRFSGGTLRTSIVVRLPPAAQLQSRSKNRQRRRLFIWLSIGRGFDETISVKISIMLVEVFHHGQAGSTVGRARGKKFRALLAEPAGLRDRQPAHLRRGRLADLPDHRLAAPAGVDRPVPRRSDHRLRRDRRLAGRPRGAAPPADRDANSLPRDGAPPRAPYRQRPPPGVADL